MRLLIVTQKVDKNDDVLGFFHRWIIEFAKHCTSVTVICLWKGVYDLPSHVRVFSLGKEAGVSRVKYLARFFWYIWKERHAYDAVFVHMNQVYVVLAGWWWKLTGKKVGLWYVHKQVSWTLRVAEKFVDVIFTAAKESCRIVSDKIQVVGHGVDIDQFPFREHLSRDGDVWRIVTIGRITRIKNLDIFIDAARILERRTSGYRSYAFDIVGAATSDDDRVYEAELKDKVSREDISSVRFLGNVPYKDIDRVYITHDGSVNLTPDGGLDKVVIESMAAGVPCLTSNNAYRKHLEPYAHELLFTYRDAADLAEKLVYLFEGDAEHLDGLRRCMRMYIEKTFGLSQLVSRLVSTLT